MGKRGMGRHGKGVSHKPSQTEGDAFSHARRKAMDRAAANSRKNLPKTFSYTVSTLPTKKELQLFYAQRTVRFTGIQSSHCETVPITPPHPTEADGEKADGEKIDAAAAADDDDDDDDGQIGYHIVVFESEEHGTLQALVREHDGYAIAIRRQPKDETDNSGWFCFNDVELPVHLFGERNKHISYNTGYNQPQMVQVGIGFLDKMVQVLLGFNEENYLHKSGARLQMLETLMVVVGEAQRLTIIRRFIVINLLSELWIALGGLAFWVNHWANLSDASMHVKLAMLVLSMLATMLAMKSLSRNKKDELENEAALRFVEANKFLKEFGANKVPLTPNQSLKIMGRRSELDGDKLSLALLMSYAQLLNFEMDLVPMLIMREDGYKGTLEVKKREVKMKF